MASRPPGSSWNPALMPNTIANHPAPTTMTRDATSEPTNQKSAGGAGDDDVYSGLKAGQEEAESVEENDELGLPADSKDDGADAWLASQDAPDNSTLATVTVSDDSATGTRAPRHSSGDVDAWFPQDAQDHNDAWLADEAVAADHTNAQDGSIPAADAESEPAMPMDSVVQPQDYLQQPGRVSDGDEASPSIVAAIPAQKQEAPVGNSPDDGHQTELPVEQSTLDLQAAEEPMSELGPDVTSSMEPEADLAGKDASQPAHETESMETECTTETAEETPNDASLNHSGSLTTHAQHTSSPSFSRTVSPQVSFMDEEETDWTLPRPGPDTSSFLPHSLDRSNSFPPVPPAQTVDSGAESHALPATQASDILSTALQENGGDGGGFGSSGQEENYWQSIGGEVQDFQAQASEARYEEGIPLIPHEPETGEGEATRGSDVGIADAFAQSAENEDDFFATIPESDGQETEERPSHVMPLERKSTMQVIGLGEAEPMSQQDTTGVTPEGQGEESMRSRQQQDGAADHDDDSAARAMQANNDGPPREEIESKWQQAFAGDDDEGFLLDEAAPEHQHVDPAAFLGSDDEGFLEDEELETVAEPQPTRSVSSTSRYTPTSLAPQGSLGPQQPPTSYAPSPYAPQAMTPPTSLHAGQQPGPTSTTGYAPWQYGQAPVSRPQPASTPSFTGKTKSSPSTPYDLLSELVPTPEPPRKRTSMQQLSSAAVTAPPPRSTSMYSPASTPSLGPGPTPVPAPGVPNLQRPPPSHASSAPSLRSQGSFFEELPVTTKARPAARQGPQSPALDSPAPPQSMPGPPRRQISVSQQQPFVPPDAAVGNLVKPERVSPYAPLQHPTSVTAPMGAHATRYASAPVQQPAHQAAPVPTASTRYSPAPPGPRPGGSYSSSSGPAANPPQPALPHLPRTSSPLAQFETNMNKIHGTHGDSSHTDRRSCASFEPRLTRVTSLPPTHEVDEEEENGAGQAYPPSHVESRFSPVSALAHQTAPATCQTATCQPPTWHRSGPPAPSPPKRSTTNYIPQAAPATQSAIVPPPRPSTQSPGATRNIQGYTPSDYGPRPSSAHSMAPRTHHSRPSQQIYSSGLSIHTKPLSTDPTNMVAPTDGREHDPLQRWMGVPLIAWGVGGLVITSFPTSLPRFSMTQTTPTTVRTHGEVRIQSIRDIDPLSDQVAKFPGPLKGKSKKKEALTWLAAGIDAQEKEIPDVSFHSQLSLEAKRGVERLLLWRLLHMFIEFDGVLEGNSAVEEAVRSLLSPAMASPLREKDGLYYAAATFAPQTGPANVAHADASDGSAMEQMRYSLLKGDGESAVWAAVDKRLWGHAMLISHTVSPELYKRVAHEFVRKEVNYPGHSNESMAALYKVLSGNFDDCVDELVPIHARAGLQLVSKELSSGTTKDAMDGLDKWRETLSLILSNRSTDDVRGLKALGKLLASYGRAEAAQICFIFSRSISVFGGVDDGDADFVLVGSDHRHHSDGFSKETEALQLSEMYEYGLSLAGGGAAAAGAPHLAAYKLQHAITLAEYGYRDKALQYCDSIAAAIVSQTRRSPYHHVGLQAAVDDFAKRLKQAPKDGSSSWMSKPSMGKVSDSMWNRFNKFVAGDEGGDASGRGAHEAGNGPFARIAATPSMSRSPSASNLDNFASSPSYGASVPPAAPHAMPSRYAPTPGHAANPYAPVSEHASAPTASYTSAAAPYTPAASHTSASASYTQAASSYAPNTAPMPPPGSSPNDMYRNPYAPTNAAVNDGAYAPSGYPPQASAPQPAPHGAAQPYLEQPPSANSLQPGALQASPVIFPMGGNAQPGIHQDSHTMSSDRDSVRATTTNDQGYGSHDTSGNGGYEPPPYQPYGYEPPSYEPGPEMASDEADDGPKPNKKSFMDDDFDDDIPALKPQEKSNPSQNREHDELFRKAVEEDEKKAAAAAAQQANKKGWGFSGWFKGGKKNDGNIGETTAGKPIRAKLGEQSSFVYDPELKRWVNKKSGAENTEASKSTPPPPKAMLRSTSGIPAPPTRSNLMPTDGRASAPPRAAPPPQEAAGEPMPKPSDGSLGVDTPAMSRQTSYSGLMAPTASEPPSRPGTSMSNASSIDDLLAAAGPRKAGQKKPRKGGGRYVDIMAK